MTFFYSRGGRGQALHAGVLGYHHPTLNKTLRFEFSWPADFTMLVNALRLLGPFT